MASEFLITLPQLALAFLILFSVLVIIPFFEGFKEGIERYRVKEKLLKFFEE